MLEGAQARADSIRADIGRNLILASQQDSDRYDAKQKQANAGASFSFGSMTGNAYLGATVGKTRSNYDSAVKQTGLFAGSGGYDIYVGKHTQLDGAVIASDAEATKNRLSTETLGFSNLHNKADYKSTTVGINLGMSGAFDKPNKGDALGGGPSGLSVASTSGSESGTTRAAVSAGTIEVRSDKDTGRDSIAGLSRDTAGANGSIGKIFDKDKVREQIEFQQAFGQLGMQIAGDVADELKKQDEQLWGEGKPGRVALHAAIAGIGAALGGGDVAGAVTGTIFGDVAAVITNTVAAATGGLAGGLSGAGGAANADMFNRQLHPDEQEWIEKNAKEYARKKGISEDEAVRQLAAQGYRMVQTGVEGEWDENAAAFLRQAHGLLPDTGYMFYAPPFQRNDAAMYALTTQAVVDFYVRNGLTLPDKAKVVDAATRNAQTIDLMSRLTWGAAGAAAIPALAGLPPTLMSWAMANPADAVAIGLVSAETAAVIQTGAFSPVSIGAAIPAQVTSAGFKVGISAEEIAAINVRFGGEIAFRDTGVIMANASRYDGFYNKISSIIRDIAGTHVFDNSNKRTAVEVVERLIARNGVDGRRMK